MAGRRSTAKTESVCIDLDFETAPAGNFKLIIMYQMLGIIEIDEFNNIIVS